MGNDKFSNLYEKFPQLLPEKSIIECDDGLYQIIKEMLGAIKIYQDADLEKLITNNRNKTFLAAQKSSDTLGQQVSSLNEQRRTGQTPTGSEPIEQG